jgi:hypothetical protein
MSTPIPIDLPTESLEDLGGQAASTHLINGFAEAFGEDGKAAYAIYAAPGLTRWDIGTDGHGTPYSGYDRGKIVLNDTNLVAALGNNVVQFGIGGAGTTLGTITETTPVIMALNRATPAQIAIVTQQGSYYLCQQITTAWAQSTAYVQNQYVVNGSNVYQCATSGTSSGVGSGPTGTGTGISDGTATWNYSHSGNIWTPSPANLPSPNSVAYLNGYFFFGISNGEVWQSNYEDGTTVNALAFSYANAFSDRLVRVFTHFGMLYVFCSTHLEVWQNAGTVPFALSPVYQNVELGTVSPYSIASTEAGMFWVDHKGMVRFGRDMNAQRVSTHTVERAIAGLSLSDREAIQGSMMTYFGHECYVMSSTQWTWMFDRSTKKWTERKSYGQANWLASSAISFDGAYILGSNSTGKLYYLDQSNFTEDGAPLLFEATCKSAHAFPGGMTVDRLDIDVTSGVGNSSVPIPLMSVDYSDDGGKTFKGERFFNLGAAGQFNGKIRLNKWGRISHKGRAWRFRADAAVVRGITQVVMQARKANA